MQQDESSQTTNDHWMRSQPSERIHPAMQKQESYLESIFTVTVGWRAGQSLVGTRGD